MKQRNYIFWILSGILLFLLGGIFGQMRESIEGTKASEIQVAAAKIQAPQIALTFDDGPNREHTKRLLDGLKKRGVKASFFLMGNKIAGNEKLVKRMHDEGHLIGNHTFDHVQLTKLTKEEACTQITKTNELIYAITGEYPQFLRPPFGEWNKDLDCAFTMLPVLWTVDPVDWNKKDADRIVQNVECAVHEGDIILLHDNYESSVTAAFQIVDDLTRQGYEFVTVDQLILQ